MKIIRTTVLLCAFGLAVISAVGTELTAAQTEEGKVLKAANALSTWAREIFDAYKSWGTSINRGKLADSLGHLNEAIFRYRVAKSLFLNRLEAQVIDKQKAREDALALKAMLEDIRQQLNEPVAVLAQHSEVNGDAAAKALSDAVAGRRIWLEEFLKTPASEQHKLIAEGRKTLAALDAASEQLAKTVQALRKE
jgi:hypothetical protein